MKENKYDDDHFFKKYGQMDRSQKGLEGAGERHTLKMLLIAAKKKDEQTEMISIRDMIFEDIPRLSEIYRQFWNEPSDIGKMQTTFQKLKDDKSYIFLSAVDDNGLVGTVMGVVCDELYGSCRPFFLIENLIVDQAHRRKGVAKALFAELENRAKARDCHQMILVTEANREDACAFYKANGFQQNNAGFKKKL